MADTIFRIKDEVDTEEMRENDVALLRPQLLSRILKFVMSEISEQSTWKLTPPCGVRRMEPLEIDHSMWRIAPHGAKKLA